LEIDFNFIQEKLNLQVNAMALNKEQEELYKKTMEEAKKQLEGIEGEMEKEIQIAREKLAKLQESKESYKQIYIWTAKLLGVEVEIEEENEEKSSKHSKSSPLSTLQ